MSVMHQTLECPHYCAVAFLYPFFKVRFPESKSNALESVKKMTRL